MHPENAPTPLRVDFMNPIDGAVSDAPARVLLVPEKGENDEWTYPDTWTPDDREAWEGGCGEIIHHAATVERTQAKIDAHLTSPAVMLEMKRIEVAAAKRGAERVRRQALGAEAWINARAQFGADVSRIDMVEDGDVIIMRRMSEASVDASHKRAKELHADKMRQLPAGTAYGSPAWIAADERGDDASLGAVKDAVVDHCTIGGLDAVAAKARVRELMARYWGLWTRMRKLRDEMITGWRSSEGKD